MLNMLQRFDASSGSLSHLRYPHYPTLASVGIVVSPSAHNLPQEVSLIRSFKDQKYKFRGYEVVVVFPTHLDAFPGREIKESWDGRVEWPNVVGDTLSGHPTKVTIQHHLGTNPDQRHWLVFTSRGC